MLKTALKSGRVRFGAYELDRRALFLTRRGRPVDAPKRSLAVLARLLEEPGRVVPREELIAAAWSETHVSPTSLGEAVSRLRQALEDDPRRPTYVQTVRGRGYRLLASGAGRYELSAGAATLAAGAAALGALGARGWASLPSPGPAVLARLAGDGRIAGTLALPPLAIEDIALAPDGRRVALSVDSGGGSDVWIFDPATESLARMTDGGDNVEAVWTPDGEWLVWAARRDGGFDLVRCRVAACEAPETLLTAPGDQFPESFSADGLTLVYSERSATSGFDLRTLRRTAGGWSSRPLRATPANEYLGSFAPALPAIAFVSDQTGLWEAYVKKLEPGAPAVRVSRGGVRDVFWSADGSSVHYVQGDRVVRVPVGDDGAPQLWRDDRFEVPARVARVEPAPEGGFLAAVY